MSQKRPNVLLIFTDQQRFDTIAATGNPVIRTPAMDRLANEGVAFTSAYSPSPVCISARCSMIYGQYPQHTGCYENTAMPTDDRPSFMHALTEAGYRTHGLGKCHFSPDRHALRGFQTRQEQEEMAPAREEDDYMVFLAEQDYGHAVEAHGVRGEMYYVPQLSQLPARLHPTQWVGEQTVNFINDQACGGQPWMLFSSYVHPHPPFAPPHPWHKLYRASMMPLPKLPQDFESLHTYVNHFQNRYKYRDQGIDQNLLRAMKAYYYACISFVDYQVGRTVEALERTGQLDDTLIVFTSDHGELLGDYNCFGKRSMLDSAARIPMLLRWPGAFEGGRRVDQPVSLVDIAPTICAAAGVSMPGMQLDGEDLANVAAGTSGREMVFSQHDSASKATYMALSREWKYVYSAADNYEMLFDRVGDPAETRNRAGVVFCRAADNQMRQSLIGFLKDCNEQAALDGDDWKIYPTLQEPRNPDAGLLIQDPKWPDFSIPGYGG